MLIINEKISIPVKEFEFSFARSPGPGGQHVNKVNSKVILRWEIGKSSSLPADVKQRFVEKYKRRIAKTGEVIVTSHRYRDQGRNVADAMHKLRELVLAVARPPVKRKKTKPSRSSVRRRLDNKRRNSDKKRSRRSPRSDD
ncbi:MAG: alternative ribosome rescue aminoacyl-tRNA hydrolase ArfB [Planctomycetota bacterium]